MTTRFQKLIIFIAFLVLLFVEASQARWLEPTIYEIDGEIVEFYKHWYVKKVEDIDDEEVKSTYISDLHAKLMDRYGAKLMWRVDVFLSACFSLLFTDLVFKIFFFIVSTCSARVSKPIRCYV
ncbi:hypothetical protein N665_0078s0007 [Sinapis alba]|nr:hypothetical protein N665_0078s0007 [Sinapis alba]